MCSVHSKCILHRLMPKKNLSIQIPDLWPRQCFGVFFSFFCFTFSRISNFYRWMAPESFHRWQFSDKSTVWSFGVLLWEIFSYGMQPYCGYSNHEVLDVISRRQLLSCPDQCPAKMYSLMHECWAEIADQRPTFKVCCYFFILLLVLFWIIFTCSYWPFSKLRFQFKAEISCFCNFRRTYTVKKKVNSINW